MTSLAAWFAGKVVTYTCDDGLLFPDGMKVKDVYCTNQSSLSNVSLNCKCELFIINQEFYYIRNAQRLVCNIKPCMSTYILCVTDDRCTSIPAFSNAQPVSPVTTDVNSTVIYACDKGYAFTNDVITNNLTCNESRAWQGPMMTSQIWCTGT